MGPNRQPHADPNVLIIDQDANTDVYVFPVTPAQDRIWQADEAYPGNPIYNTSFRWLIDGRLETEILEHSFSEIVRRHEILRTTFGRANGSPVQIISPRLCLSIPSRDLRSLPVDKREPELEQLCEQEAVRRFDLRKGPLIRVGLVRMSDDQHVLMLTLHHIIADGWSIALIMEELEKIYLADASGKPCPLPDLQIQFGDYAVWLLDRTAGGGLASQLHYWTTKLANYSPVNVQTDYIRAESGDARSSIISSVLPRGVTDAVKDLSNRQGGTLFVTSLAVCMVLLHHYTKKADIAVGSPLAGRNQLETEDLIGLFVNYAVFRVQIDPGITFAEVVHRVRDVVLEAVANQDIPFEHVCSKLDLSGACKTALFHSVNFICQKEYARASKFLFEFAGLRIRTLPSKSQGALYDLNFFMVERSDGWRLSIEYNRNLYKRGSAQIMLDDFCGMLEQLSRGFDISISQLRLQGGVHAPTVTGEAGALSAPKLRESYGAQ